jgi:hypothetical protein
MKNKRRRKFPFTPHTTLRSNLWIWAVPFLKHAVNLLSIRYQFTVNPRLIKKTIKGLIEGLSGQSVKNL